ncbi:MAG: glycosyltransferase family 2 protein [Deltaproteobacteria bacterium]|nr:glycosyltransferase family 2 protein [Deltaproteobacteria bacterium]
MSTARISIVVPARNEHGNLVDLLPEIKRYGDEHILVDGNSTDGTVELAESHGFTCVKDSGRGKGDAIRTGIATATGGILVFIDADHSHDPGDIPKLVAPILAGTADHVSGSRMRGGSDELHGTAGELLRLYGSTLITLGINLRFGTTLTDSQNGFRAIRRDVAMALDLREDITTIEQEMIVKTLRKGYRLMEVPTHEYRRRHGKSSFQVHKVAVRYVTSWLRLLAQ